MVSCLCSVRYADILGAGLRFRLCSRAITYLDEYMKRVGVPSKIPVSLSEPATARWIFGCVIAHEEGPPHTLIHDVKTLRTP